MQPDNMIVVPIKSRVATNTHSTNEYRIRLWEDIGHPSEYQDEIDIIECAKPGDTIIMDICTDGGLLDTAALFNRALRATDAHTVAVIGPSCSSSGSVIALSCKEFVIDDTSSLMLHTSSYGFHQSKDVDIYEHATFSRKSLERLYRDVYSGFISESQLEEVINGKPFYFDCDELEEALTNLSKYREEKAKECGCEECLSSLGDTSDEECVKEGDLVEIVTGEVTNKRNHNGMVRLSVDISPEIYERIEGKELSFLVPAEEYGE